MLLWKVYSLYNNSVKLGDVLYLYDVFLSEYRT